MKLTRSTILKIVAGLGIFMISYSLIRYFTGVGFGETVEKYIFDGIIFAALGLFLYNRKLTKDEKQAKAAAEEEAERKAEEEAEKAEKAAKPLPAKPPVSLGPAFPGEDEDTGEDAEEEDESGDEEEEDEDSTEDDSDLPHWERR